MSEVIDIKDQGEFNDLLETEEWMVVKFTAPSWCAPCRAFKPHFEKVAELAPKSDDPRVRKVTFVSIDIDDNDWASPEYGILGVPTVLLFQSGKTYDTLRERTTPKFMTEIKSALRR